MIDGIFLVQVNKTLRVATPGSEGEFINPKTFDVYYERQFTLPQDPIFYLLDAFLIILIPMCNTLSYIYVTVSFVEHKSTHNGASKSCIKAT